MASTVKSSTLPLRSTLKGIVAPSLRTTSQTTLSFIPKKRDTGWPSTSRILSPGLQTALAAGRILLDVADHGRQVRLAHRMSHRPDDAGEEQGQEQAEERARDGDDDLVQRGNLRELRAIDVGLAFDHIHRRELRQRDEPAKRESSLTNTARR